MNTLLRRFYCLLTGFFVSVNLSNAVAADTNLPPRLTVELRDGSRVVGQSVEKSLKFHSALLGDLKLEVKDIRSIDCVTTNSAKLTTTGGDVLAVWFVTPELRVNSGFGKVELPVNSIRRAVVSVPGNTGRMREGLVASWFGEGDGKSSSIIVSNSASLVSMQQTRQLTVAVWIKPNSISGEYPVILSKGGNEPSRIYGGYELLLAWGENDLVFDSGGTQIITRGANGRWIKSHLGEWIHVAFVIDDRVKTAKFYVNGQPTNDEYNEGSSPSDDLNFDLPNNLYIGAPDPASNSNRSRFDGEMRDLKLFNRALTAKEIHEDYEAGHSN